jgi:cold shock CspA family protein
MLPTDLHIDGRNVHILPEWREKIATEMDKLARHAYEPILHARVEIIGTGHHRHGAFEMHLVLGLAGQTLTITRQGEYVLPLIVEAFKAMDRRLKEFSRLRQQKVKVHEAVTLKGTVLRTFPEEDYGFLESPDGGEVYFHANALKNANIDTLPVGARVEFAQESGEKGLQAAWVRVLE